MLHLLLATALLVQLPATDPAAGSPAVPDAFESAEVRELVRGASRRLELVDRAIAAYKALATERLSIGLDTPNRKRLLYREENVARIRWSRDGTGRIEMLGARAVAPVFDSEAFVPDQPPVRLAFDPVDDGFVAGLGGRDFLRHPFDAANEADYRYRGGDSTGVRLPGGALVRLREIVIEPRRGDPRLVAGSIWIDADSYSIVRAELRPVRPFDLWAEARAAGRDGGGGGPGRGDGERRTSAPRGGRRVGGDGWIQGEIRQISVEYALWDGRWWLPAIVVFEGEARVGSFLGVPLRMERRYDDYRVEADPAPPPPAPRAEALAAGASGSGRCAEGADGCHCRAGRCWSFDVDRPGDDAELLASGHFTGTIYDGESPVLSERELAELEERLRALARPPWRLAGPAFDGSIARAGLLRYNRVEGLSVGARGRLDVGGAALDATARYGISGELLQFEVGASLAGAGPAPRLAAYRRLAAANPETRPFGAGHTLMALVFGRDDGEYFLAEGVELRSPAGSAAGPLEWRLYAERQSPVARATDYSFRRALGGDVAQRDNLAADRAEQVGLALSLRLQHGLDPAALRLGAELAVTAEAGTYDFLRPGLTLRASSPLGPKTTGALELAAGTTVGESPAQGEWFLGGPATLRGFPGGVARGEAYWRARAELATPTPGARLILFGDAGWAGARDAFGRRGTRPLAGVGIGVGLLDGLIRFDVAKAVRGGSGWRADLYLDGIL